jgi:hypothetical protein
MKCSICWAWKPKQWDGSKGGCADTVAQCSLKAKFTTANEVCEDGAYVARVRTVGRVLLPAHPHFRNPTTGPTTPSARKTYMWQGARKLCGRIPIIHVALTMLILPDSSGDWSAFA